MRISIIRVSALAALLAIPAISQAQILSAPSPQQLVVPVADENEQSYDFEVEPSDDYEAFDESSIPDRIELELPEQTPGIEDGYDETEVPQRYQYPTNNEHYENFQNFGPEESAPQLAPEPNIEQAPASRTQPRRTVAPPPAEPPVIEVNPLVFRREALRAQQRRERIQMRKRLGLSASRPTLKYPSFDDVRNYRRSRSVVWPDETSSRTRARR